MTFDFDGTLLDGSPWKEVIVRTCHDLSTAHPWLDAECLVAANAEVWESYFPNVEASWALGDIDGRTVTNAAWRRTLAACGPVDAATAQFATETYLRNRRLALRLFDDVGELFRRLGSDFPIGLVTNGASDTQRDALRALGIEHRFRAVVISGEVGVSKPDRAIFDMVVDRMGVERENLWHVGDSLNADVAGARAAHLMAVWLNRQGIPRESWDPLPDYEIASLTDLPALLTQAGLS